ncbi:MAG: multicomponent Na+:H+ antiporter subunit [Gaiellaceae bacterium]|nr:multicomponent Na+:H+ antiporter subunit [Gaiellaceae bacterium]
MTRRARIAIFVPALAVFAGLLCWAIAGLPDFGNYHGPYGFVLNRIAVPERHMTNVVTALVFDYRGFDTMGEEFILFAAVTGVVLLLRARGRDDGPDESSEGIVRNEAMRVVGSLAVGAAVLVGLWLIAFGFVTPGGGFQGGVAVAAGIVLVYLVSSYRAWSGIVDPRALEPLEGLGAATYVIVGLAALVSGVPFLSNVLGPGDVGTVWSGGSAAIVNWAVGLEVAAANLILFREFLEEYVVPLETA